MIAAANLIGRSAFRKLVSAYNCKTVCARAIHTIHIILLEMVISNWNGRKPNTHRVRILVYKEVVASSKSSDIECLSITKQ